MIRTKLERTSVLGRLALGDKPGDTNRPKRGGATTRTYKTELRHKSRKLAGVLQCLGWLPLACVFAVTGMAVTQAQAATEAVLHNFATPPKGMDPFPGVIRDSTGNFYGAADGGRYGFGVVYKVDTAGNQTVLHTF